MALSPYHFRFLAIYESAVPALINFVLNGAIAWWLFRSAAFVPFSGPSSIAGDTLITSFLLPLFSCLIITWLIQRGVERGELRPLVITPRAGLAGLAIPGASPAPRSSLRACGRRIRRRSGMRCIRATGSSRIAVFGVRFIHGSVRSSACGRGMSLHCLASSRLAVPNQGKQPNKMNLRTDSVPLDIDVGLPNIGGPLDWNEDVPGMANHRRETRS